MKKPLLILIGICISSFAYSQSIKIKGDLYYSFFSLASLYGQPDSIYAKYEESKSNPEFEEKLSSENNKISWRILEENELIRCPYVFIKGSKDWKVIYFKDDNEYQNFTGFTYNDLIRTRQKVKVELSATKLNERMYVCESVESVKLVLGETLTNQPRKFKIEDYR